MPAMFGPVGGACCNLSLLQTVEANGADVESLVFTGLTGDTAYIYWIEFCILQSAGGNFDLEFNGDTTGKMRRHTVNSSSGTIAKTTMLVGGDTDIHEGRVIIRSATNDAAGNGKNRHYQVDTIWVDNGTTTPYSRLYVGQWTNSVDEIISLGIVGQSSPFAVGDGSWARLYEYCR